MTAWKDFKKGNWSENIDVLDFINLNYSQYEGDAEFLEGPTENTKKLWDELTFLFKKKEIMVALLM